VYGALRLYNGTPSARITVSSTKRVLGVVSYIADNNETFAAPANVRSNASFDRSLNGTYFVCPITKAQPREMQRVCIEAADFTSDGKGK
jgi:hypothetical protein